MKIETRWTDHLEGSTRFDLMHEGRSVSHIDGVVPYTLRFGTASVRADGIAGVGTEEDCRRRGYSRQVMESALTHMIQGEAAISFLHGIQDFYDRFGYVSACPSYELSTGAAAESSFQKPKGSRVRLCTMEDLPAIQALYQVNSQDIIGAAVRPPDGFVWNKLKASLPAGECRVVEDSKGRVIGYVWLARNCWAVRVYASSRGENSFVIGEVMAEDRWGGSVIDACRAWAEEEGKRRDAAFHQICLSLPPVGPIAAALRFQHSLSHQRYQSSGALMARILSVERLLKALAPELRRRAQSSDLAFSGVLTLRTDIGEASLTLGDNAEHQEQTVLVDLPQATLTRLLFGAIPIDDVLDHDGIPATEPARQLLGILFPPACPHIYLPDLC